MNRIRAFSSSAFSKLKAKGFFFIFASSTINKIIGFASGWIIVRIISKAEYGVYTHAYNIYGFLLLLNGLGLSSSVLQLGSEAKDESDKRRIYSYGLKNGILVDFVLAVIVLAIGLFVPLKIEGSNKLLAMMFLLPLVTLVTDFQLMYLRINLFNKQFAVLSTLNSISVLAFSCTFAFLFKVPGLVIAGYGSHVVTAAIANRVFKVPLALNNVKFSKEEKKSVFSIAAISMVNNGLSHLMYLLDIFVIGMIIADSEVIASYKIATNIPTALQFIPSALVLFAYPHFAKNKDNKKWILRNYKKMVIPFGVFNLLLSVTLILTARPLIVFLFKEQYVDAVTPFRILSASYFFSATFRTVSGTLLVTQRKLKFNLFISIVAAVLNSCLNVFLVRSIQTTGAAIATLITTAVCGMISTIYFFIHVKRMSVEQNHDDEKKAVESNEY